MNNKDNILGIKELEEFKCLGSDCEDTCCAGWGVSIDKFTFEKWESDNKYQKIRNYLQVIPEQKRDGIDSANIAIDPETKRCPFLDADKLCDIQKEHGHESLSYTCRSFPRSRNSLFNIKEENMSLACPEAARLILNSKKQISITLQSNPVDEINLFKTIYPLPQNTSSFEISAELGWQLRSLILNILQLKEIDISSRLTIVGILAKNLDEEFEKHAVTEANIERVINYYNEIIKSKDQINRMTGVIPKSPESKFIFLRNLISSIAPYAQANPRYLEQFQRLKRAFLFGTESDESSLLNNYLNLRSNYIQKKFYNQLFENYIFHLFIKEMFPFGSKKILKQFQEIVVRIFLVQEHLISLVGDSATIDDSDVVKLVQSFTRTYEHSVYFQNALSNLLEAMQFNSLAHTCILIAE